MPGFSPYYAPQIPGALQGGYLQPMYGMESLFPYNPSLSQALMGLSQGSLLQHYQQYQQSLQEALQQQQRQLQQIQQPKASQTSQNLVDRKEKDPVKTEQKSNSSVETSSTHNNLATEQHEVDGKGADPHLDQYIVPKIQYPTGVPQVSRCLQQGGSSYQPCQVNLFFWSVCGKPARDVASGTQQWGMQQKVASTTAWPVTKH